jgi:hypothetical protein
MKCFYLFSTLLYLNKTHLEFVLSLYKELPEMRIYSLIYLPTFVFGVVPVQPTIQEPVLFSQQTDLFIQIIEAAPESSDAERIQTVEAFNQFLTHSLDNLSDIKISGIANVLRESIESQSRDALSLDYVMTMLYWNLWDKVGVNLFEFPNLVDKEKQAHLEKILKEVYIRRLFLNAGLRMNVSTYEAERSFRTSLPDNPGSLIQGLLSIDSDELVALSNTIGTISTTINTFVENHGLSWFEYSFDPFGFIEYYHSENLTERRYPWQSYSMLSKAGRMQSLNAAVEFVTSSRAKTLAIIYNRFLHAGIMNRCALDNSIVTEFSEVFEILAAPDFKYKISMYASESYIYKNAFNEYCQWKNRKFDTDICQSEFVPEVLALLKKTEFDFPAVLSAANRLAGLDDAEALPQGKSAADIYLSETIGLLKKWNSEIGDSISYENLATDDSKMRMQRLIIRGAKIA